MIQTFRAVPEYVQAIQYIGTESGAQILKWIDHRGGLNKNDEIVLKVSDDVRVAKITDWVIKNAEGDFSVYPDSTFYSYFEPIDPPPMSLERARELRASEQLCEVYGHVGSGIYCHRCYEIY